MNDDIISINNYSSSSDEFKSLPYSGWIKPCFYKDCRTISSHFTIITYKKPNLRYIYVKNVMTNVDTILIMNYMITLILYILLVSFSFVILIITCTVTIPGRCPRP